MKAARPTLVLGPSALTHPGSQEHVDTLLTTARELSITQIETAPVCPGQRTFGDSQRQLGLVPGTKRGFTISTRVESDSDGRCALNRGQIWQSVKGSLQRLEARQVDILYIPAPDSEALLEQQAAAMDDLYRQGKFKRLGLVNFSTPTLKDYLAICQQNSYVLPSVYLLTYNLLWRFPESKLIPILRSNNITLMAQSPLAGGLLTGRFAPEQLELDAERHRMYGKPCFHSASARLVALASPHGVTPAEAALRWLCWHSELGGRDGVVLGARTCEQLRASVGAVERGPLPAALVAGIETIWESVREGVRWRGTLQINREGL